GSNCQLMFCLLFSDGYSMLLPRMGHVHGKRTLCVSAHTDSRLLLRDPRGENTRECSSHAPFLTHVVALRMVVYATTKNIPAFCCIVNSCRCNFLVVYFTL